MNCVCDLSHVGALCGTHNSAFNEFLVDWKKSEQEQVRQLVREALRELTKAKQFPSPSLVSLAKHVGITTMEIL